MFTPPKFNIAPEKGPFQKESIPNIIFRGHVCVWGEYFVFNLHFTSVGRGNIRGHEIMVFLCFSPWSSLNKGTVPVTGRFGIIFWYQPYTHLLFPGTFKYLCCLVYMLIIDKYIY